MISYEELGDGKLKLVVEAVWKIEMLDQAFRSELVVEPLEGGKFIMCQIQFCHQKKMSRGGMYQD